MFLVLLKVGEPTTTTLDIPPFGLVHLNSFSAIEIGMKATFSIRNE